MDNKKQAEKHFKNGNEQYNNFNYQEAIEEFTKAIELDPQNAVAYNSRGIAYGNLKQYDKAIQDYDKAIKFDPQDAGAYNNRGITYQNLEQYEEALLDYGKAIELDPQLIQAYLNRGTTYGDLKAYDQALEDFNKVIELDPQNAKAYNNLGFVYLNLKQYDKALQNLNKAIEFDPKDSKAFYNRAITYDELGENDKAIEDYQKANELNPKLFSEESQKELKDKIDNVGKEVEDVQEFQKTLKEQKANYQSIMYSWFGGVVAVVIFSIIILLLNLDNEFSFKELTFSFFIVSINLFVARQYTNAKGLYLETDNRLVVAKLYERHSRLEQDEAVKVKIQEQLMSKIISSRLDTKNQNGTVEDIPLKELPKIMEVIDKFKNAFTPKT